MKPAVRDSDGLTNALLICGVALAPLFYVVVLIQMAARTGFDITRHAISSLSLGDAGWIQVTNFLVTGALAVLCAIGVHRALRGGVAGRWAPLLIAIFGIGMMLAGVFPTDPGFGFPDGAPEGAPTTTSTSSALHSIGFFAAFSSLTVACFVLARRFISQGGRSWGSYSIATGVAAPVLVTLGTAVAADRAGMLFFAAGLVAFGWLSATAARLLLVRSRGRDRGEMRAGSIERGSG